MEINFPDENEYIRDINFMEKNTINCWLVAGCNLDKVNPEQALNNLRYKFLYLLTNYKILRIIIKNQEEKLKWYYGKKFRFKF